MLAQSSDWPFIMTTGSTVPYATRRFNEHIIRFTPALRRRCMAGQVDEDFLADLEAQGQHLPRRRLPRLRHLTR